MKLIPQHRLYCEPFCGGAAVFFGKAPSPVEVLNDNNDLVANFYRVCKTEFDALAYLIRQTPHSRNAHAFSRQVLKEPDLYNNVRVARAFRVQVSMSYGSKLWGSYGYDRTTGSTGRKIHFKRLNFTSEITNRLERVDLECQDALKVIERCDSENSFFYLDPPYINCDQGHYAGYTEVDFERLLQLLTKIKGKFLLSNYPSAILDRYAQNHRRPMMKIERILSVNHRQKNTTTKILVGNYDFKALADGENEAQAKTDQPVGILPLAMPNDAPQICSRSASEQT